MANPTSNFGWQMPQNTDLVKDLPADFEVFGQAVDTSLMDLKGGTTGQVLSKASDTDMDFTWVAQDDSNAIQNAIVDAKGDLISATAADTPARLAVGADGTYLQADSTTATGLKWGTVSAGGMTLISTTTLSGSSVTLSSIPTTYTDLRLYIKSYYASAQDFLSVRLNGDSGATSYYSNAGNLAYTTNELIQSGGSSFGIIYAYNTSSAQHLSFVTIEIPQYTDTSGGQLVTSEGYGGATRQGWNSRAIYNNRSAAITSITFLPASGTMTAGTVYLYGVK